MLLTTTPWKNFIFFKNQNIQVEAQDDIVKGEWIDKTPVDLNILKDAIGIKESETVWDLAKRLTNPYELIYTTSTNIQLPKSVSLLKPLSRSFFKLVEMLDTMKFFDLFSPQQNFKSLHLCEGPGGFIEAFIDRAERHKKNITAIYAMTLKQTNHTIPGWRAATKLLTRHPEIHIEYGPSITGNIFEKSNQVFLENKLKHGIHLVTADGGFDFSIDFQAQEKLVFPLIVTSSYIALTCLALNGCFILKIFDSFSPITQQFLGFLANHFNEFTIYKPVTSRPCNSERYFIGKGFRGFSETSRSLFQHIMTAENNLSSIFNSTFNREDIFSDTIEKINILTENYVKEQRIALKRVLDFPLPYYTSADEPNKDIIQDLWKEQSTIGRQWCQTFHIPTIQSHTVF